MEDNVKEIIKFDVGADGFQKMIYVLGFGALIVLITGIIFLTMFLREVKQLS